MHKVTKTATVAFTVFVLPAAGFTEISNWGKLCVERAALEKKTPEISAKRKVT